MTNNRLLKLLDIRECAVNNLLVNIALLFYTRQQVINGTHLSSELVVRLK